MRHESALIASVRATYGIVNIREEKLTHLADLLVWLPAGSPLWQSTGGPRALTGVEESLRFIDYRLRVLAWIQTEDASKNRNQPKPPEPIPFAGQVDKEAEYNRRQLAAREKRAKRFEARNG